MIGTGWKRWALAVATVLAVAGVPGLAPAEEARTVLEEILDIMKRSGQITEEQRKALLQRAEREARQAEAERQQARKDAVAGLRAGVDNYRPFLRSADGDVQVTLGGRLHVDYDAVEDGARTLTGTPLVDRFLVRRARLELGGTFFKWIDLSVEAEVTNNPALNDGFLDLRFAPEAALRVGQFKQPFSLEELTSDNLIDFVERSVVNELAPSRDVGAMLWGNLLGGVVSYGVSASNGTGLNTADNNDAKDLNGRLVLAPFKTTGLAWLKGLQVAGDVTWGDEGTLATAQGRTMARTSNRFVFFAAQPARGNRTRWGTDLLWVAGPASLKFEYDRQTNQRKRLATTGGDLDDVTATGWYAAATYVLTGEDKAASGLVVPRRLFIPENGRMGPGAWEVALRWAELAFDSDDPVDFFDGNIANGITGGRRTAENGVEALTVGLNWYLNARLRYTLNWTEYWYDNPLGTPFSCASLACSAAQLRPRSDPTSWELLTRFQLWF